MRAHDAGRPGAHPEVARENERGELPDAARFSLENPAKSRTRRSRGTGAARLAGAWPVAPKTAHDPATKSFFGSESEGRTHGARWIEPARTTFDVTS
jgi:hypothetical protein